MNRVRLDKVILGRTAAEHSEKCSTAAEEQRTEEHQGGNDHTGLWDRYDLVPDELTVTQEGGCRAVSTVEVNLREIDPAITGENIEMGGTATRGGGGSIEVRPIPVEDVQRGTGGHRHGVDGQS